jgi:hypothetical protein
MPINVLSKNTPRGRGPEASKGMSQVLEEKQEGQDTLKEADLAAQEEQALWESQEIGKTSWSGASGSRYNDPD